jgi:hypothetical protein
VKLHDVIEDTLAVAEVLPFDFPAHTRSYWLSTADASGWPGASCANAT